MIVKIKCSSSSVEHTDYQRQQMLNTAREAITNVKTVKAFSNEEREIEKF